MQRPGRWSRPIPLALLAFALIVIVAIPVLAASPSPSPTSSTSPRVAASAAPERAKPSKVPGAQRENKKEKTPEVDVTLKGVVGTRVTADGGTEYTLTVGSTVLTLEAGPAWFYGDKHPLKRFVGKTVTVVGEQAKGATEVEVRSVDGTTIREPGKPPWAGGWKRVGKIHPGWSQEKWDRWQAKVSDQKAKFGLDCWPPGWCKDADGKPVTPNATEAPSGGS
jgi:hypothetical protein